MTRRYSLLAMGLMLFVALAFVTSVQAEDSDKININEATVEELSQIKFIGPTIAERIVQYRENSGSFGKAEDLMNVKGIGPKTFEKIKDCIIL